MKLIKVDKDLVPYVWIHVKELLKKPTNRSLDNFDLEHVYASLYHGTQDLWMLVDETTSEVIVAATTEFVDYPKLKVFHVVLVGATGNRVNEWVEYCWNEDSPLIKYAKENGAAKIHSYVRDGFVKLLHKYEFKKMSTLIEKEI